MELQRTPDVVEAGRASRHGALRLIVVLTTCTAVVVPSNAQSVDPADPMRFVRWPAQDVRALAGDVSSYGLAILGAGAAVFALSLQDPHLHDLMSDAALDSRSPLVRAADEMGNVHLVRPAAVMLFLGSLASRDERFQDAAFTSLEAVIVANLITNTLKTIFGRARPYQGEGSSFFSPFSGNTSFPSGHSATAFAATTPWLLYYPSPFTTGLAVLSGGTAIARVVTDFHWVSDVVAGSAIGFATAYIFSRAHMGRSDSFAVSPVVNEDGTGVAITFRP